MLSRLHAIRRVIGWAGLIFLFLLLAFLQGAETGFGNMLECRPAAFFCFVN